MKSNRLQNKDPVDQNGIGREVTIKVEWCCVGPVSEAPPGVKAGAVWCPHPGPLPRGEGANTKNGNQVAVFFYLRESLNATNRNTTHTGSSIAESRISSMVHISTRISPRNAMQM